MENIPGRVWARIMRLAIFVAALLAVLGLTAWLAAHAFTNTSQFARAVAWGDSDTGDRRRFAERVVPNGEPRFDFEPATEASLNRYAGAFRKLKRPTRSGVGEMELDALLRSTGTLAFLVAKDDELLYEGYFNGGSRTEHMTSFSVAKSFASALVGAAIADGYLGGVEDRIVDYLPELSGKDSRFSEIRIRDLLSMSSGIRYVERGLPWSDDAATYYAPDLRALALSAGVEEPPGQTFLYNNYNPLLIGMILERVTGRRVADYLSERIWSRIGAEAPASWSLDRQDGFEKMESGINARAIDYLKFGRLFLRKGDWDGTRILPEEWVEASTRTRAPRSPGSSPYGYFWWIEQDTPGGRHFAAAGKHGQYIFVAAELDLVIVRFGLRDPLHGRWREVFEEIAARVAAAERDH